MVVPFHSSYADRSQCGTACACGDIACFDTSRETASAVALIRVARGSRLCVGSHSSHVAPRSCTGEERSSAGAVPFRSTCADYSQRGPARARGKLACFATSRETASAVAGPHVGHENVGRARTSRRGLASKERGLPPVQCPLMMCKVITTSAARRAHAASLRVSPPPERQPAQWRLFACHVNAGCVLEAIA